MRLIRYQSPLSNYRGLDELLETALGDFTGNRFHVETYADADNSYIRAELPGVTRDEIDLQATRGELTLVVNRKSAEPVTFSRSFSLPVDVEAEKLSATYENGVLTVKLPKQEAAKPRKIAIN